MNDGVMGGRSRSQAVIAGDGLMKFTGTLSLENNGGFASVRSRPGQPFGLTNQTSILLRVKGDGRRYTLNLYPPSRRTAFSYQMDFATKNQEWIEIEFPVANFVAHSFGRPIPGMQLVPEQIASLGILLGDKRAGPFKIVVDWIRIK